MDFRLVDLNDFILNGTLTTGNIYFDKHNDVVYINLNTGHEPFHTEEIEVIDNITLFYVCLKNSNENEIDDVISKMNRLDFTGVHSLYDIHNDNQLRRIYTGLEIKGITDMMPCQLLDVNNHIVLLPYVEIHQFPCVINNEKCVYYVINFDKQDDPFDHTDDEFTVLNQETKVLVDGSDGNMKQIAIISK
jgi:hypothetical protein